MTQDTSGQPQRQVGLLFTAFEPSGDAHAAPVIRALLELSPELKIYAWGGQQMREAGATLIDQTIDDAAMGLGAVSRIRAVRKHIKDIRRWSHEYRVLAHIPVDSPAANFPVCKQMRRAGARVVHLVAPQLWAWGAWRAKKLRRLTDLVLCLLPFEEEWFSDRSIPAKFIGHPRINRDIRLDDLQSQMRSLPQGAPRLALFPGSRRQEVKANISLLVNVYEELQGRHAGIGGVIVAADADLAALIRRKHPFLPVGLHVLNGHADAAIGWCDLALAVSGTITLDIARQFKPMVGVYRAGLVSWLGAKVMLRTPWCLLPNIIAQREIVPEFVPHIGGAGPIVRQASLFIADSKNAAIQRAELKRVCQRYTNKKPAIEAARAILGVISETKDCAEHHDPATARA